MSCEDIQKELEAFLGNEIDEPKRNEIQSHLDKCQNCSEVLRQLTRLSEVLQTWKGIEPSPIRKKRIQFKRLRKHKTVKRQKRKEEEK